MISAGIRKLGAVLLLAAAAVFWASPARSGPINVVYVTHTSASMTQYTPFLESIYGAGNVTTTTGAFTNPLGVPSEKATLEAADLIIIGRQTSSDQYVNTADERSFWNQLNVPILLNSGYLVRTNRFDWLVGDQNEVTIGSVDVVAPGDPIFAGVTPVGGEVQIYGTAILQSISAGVGTGTLGQIVAVHPANGDDRVVIARWDGTESAYRSSGVAGAPGEKRVFFATPGTNDWLSAHMTADGRQMLKNAITYLVPVPEPSTLALAGLGLAGLLAAALRRRRR